MYHLCAAHHCSTCIQAVVAYYSQCSCLHHPDLTLNLWVTHKSQYYFSIEANGQLEEDKMEETKRLGPFSVLSPCPQLPGKLHGGANYWINKAYTASLLKDPASLEKRPKITQDFYSVPFPLEA
ncbi:transmembrane protein 241 [Platysternon megacephalum]|uniref:Transmembrane protein 241 n=1 Tax=Platysternon megacephalum TaxID=55544 RepID=A0A4D9EPG1_9SAUR|nr:transmembrane protein 241 [Platysternon megacephalum]